VDLGHAAQALQLRRMWSRGTCAVDLLCTAARTGMVPGDFCLVLGDPHASRECGSGGLWSVLISVQQQKTWAVKSTVQKTRQKSKKSHGLLRRYRWMMKSDAISITVGYPFDIRLISVGCLFDDSSISD
jgi:hypothetical protein